MNGTENHNSKGYFQRLVKTKMECNRLSTELELETDSGKELQFKKYTSFLAKELVPKYQKSDKDKPDILKNLNHLEVTKLSVNDCRHLLTDFNELMEEMGIISKANTEYQLDGEGGNQ